MTAKRVVISGRVQGVWFRGWAQETAQRLKVDGWIRNRRDGTVEAVFCGEPEAVQAMLEARWRGPPMARVMDIQQFPHEEPVGPGFRSKPSV